MLVRDGRLPERLRCFNRNTLLSAIEGLAQRNNCDLQRNENQRTCHAALHTTPLATGVKVSRDTVLKLSWRQCITGLSVMVQDKLRQNPASGPIFEVVPPSWTVWRLS